MDNLQAAINLLGAMSSVRVACLHVKTEQSDVEKNAYEAAIKVVLDYCKEKPASAN